MKTNVKTESKIKNKHVSNSSKKKQEIIDQQDPDALEDAARRHREEVLHASIADTKQHLATVETNKSNEYAIVYPLRY